MKYIVGGILGILCLFLSSFDNKNTSLAIEQNVYDVLLKLGEAPSDFEPNEILTRASKEIGEDIVKKGFSKREGMNKSKRQSKHFVCTSCHNVQKEDPDLAVIDPQARLEYTAENGLPFLQGSSLYGIVNRTSFYNGDYEKKYGDLVWPARNNIREAIQLCAVECAQGRKLKDWEVESILHYLWDIQLKMSDLILTHEETQAIQKGWESGEDNPVLRRLIKSKYMSYSPATAVLPPDDRKQGYPGLEANPDNGKLIYDGSCMHCHEKKKYSYFNLDHSKMTFNYLKNRIGGYSRHSLYQVTRWGTYAKFGKHSYMPFYTEEKMSNQQLEDLRAYIEKMAS